MVTMNAFIEEAVGDPVIVPKHSGRIKTGVINYLEGTANKPATCWDDVRWIRVEFDDGKKAMFYYTGVLVDLDWVEKIKEFED